MLLFPFLRRVVDGREVGDCISLPGSILLLLFFCDGNVYFSVVPLLFSTGFGVLVVYYGLIEVGCGCS